MNRNMDFSRGEKTVGSPWVTATALYVLALVVRLVALALSDNEDGDSMIRIIYSRAVVDDGNLVPSTLWLPGHFYFLSIPYALGLTGQVYSLLFTAIFSTFSIPLVYFLVRDRAEENWAILAAVLLALFSLHIRFSIISVSDCPAVTLTLLGVLFCFRWVHNGKIGNLAVGAVAFNVASFMRFESWVVSMFPLIAVVITSALSKQTVDKERVIRAVWFSALCLVIPLLWCFFSWQHFGDVFALQHATVLDTIDFFKDHPPSTLYISAFNPAVLLFSLGPIAVICFIGLYKSFFDQGLSELAVITLFLFLFLLTTQLTGRLITQARYVLLVGSFIVVFIGPGLRACKMFLSALNTERLPTWTVAMLTVWLSLLPIVSDWAPSPIAKKIYSISPLPRFPKDILLVNSWLQTHNAGHCAIGFLLDTKATAGPWQSLLDNWYGIVHLQHNAASLMGLRQPYFARDRLSVSRFIQATKCGHVVVNLRQEFLVDGEAVETSKLPQYSNASYAIYAWGKI